LHFLLVCILELPKYNISNMRFVGQEICAVGK
jgi:hypothetical protein